MFNLNLEEVDSDGAIREAAEGLSGDTRFDFLRKSAIGGGALLSGGAILAAFAPSALAAKPNAGLPPTKEFGTGADAILNFALTLEYLESTFYTEAYSHLYGKLSAMGKNFVKTTRRDEAAHVAFLKKALGSKAIAKPSFNFKTAVTDEATFLATAYVLEEHRRARVPRTGSEPHQRSVGPGRRGFHRHRRGPARRLDRDDPRQSRSPRTVRSTTACPARRSSMPS